MNKVKKIIYSKLFRKVSRSRLNPLIAKYASDNKTLDIGSSSSPYRKYFPNITTLDIQDGKGVDIVADAHHLPIKDNSYDIVLITSVLGDCEDPYQVISEIERVLKPDGFCILNVPFLCPINDAPYDYWRFTPFTLRKLFKRSEEIKIVPVTGQIETIAHILQRMAFQSKGTKFKRLIFAIIARILIMSRIDKFITQEGYTTINRDPKSAMDCIMTSMYFAVFKKKK